MKTNPPGRPADWDRRIAEAQLTTHEIIGSRLLERVKYGTEQPDCRPTCWNCGVALGQYHVMDCSVERCPACGGQANGCSCYSASEVPVQ